MSEPVQKLGPTPLSEGMELELGNENQPSAEELEIMRKQAGEDPEPVFDIETFEQIGWMTREEFNEREKENFSDK